MLCEEGTIGREFFLIVDGHATVSRNGQKIATLGPGQYFGELALLDRRPRSATVVSDTEMLVLVLGQRQFNGILDAVPALSHKLLAAMATRPSGVRPEGRRLIYHWGRMELDAALALARPRHQGVLTTLRRDGRPQISNIAYALGDDGILRISVSEPRAKTKNLRRDPRGTLYVPGDTFWEYVVLDGDADLTPGYRGSR